MRPRGAHFISFLLLYTLPPDLKKTGPLDGGAIFRVPISRAYNHEASRKLSGLFWASHGWDVFMLATYMLPAEIQHGLERRGWRSESTLRPACYDNKGKIIATSL